jgi:hypothetical protein
MKSLPIFLASMLFLFACSEKPLLDETAGTIRLVIDKTGNITALVDTSFGKNYIDPENANYLIECAEYIKDSVTALKRPESASVVQKNDVGTQIEFNYGEGVKLTVQITPKDGYFHFKLVNAEPISEISHIVWGPYKTIMRGPIGEWLGINRSDNFSIGLLSLEPNTDGVSNIAASYTEKGSLIQLISYDHTRGRFVGWDNKNLQLRKSKPISGLTIIGSSVALWGCRTGRDSELAAIEKIEIGEGLPHPTFDGVWNKYSDEGKKFCVWGYYKENNFDEYLVLSKKLGARILCRPGGFSGNWGHFDINRKIYPGGIPSLLSDSKKARKENIGLTLYTLTTFLKPNPDPEPYLSPVPDERLQTWEPTTNLIKKVNEEDSLIILRNNENVISVLREASNKVIRVDNEFIEFKNFSVEGENILANGCTHGAFNTQPANHTENSMVRLMYVAGYHNFYPGTLDMSNEFSEKLSNLFCEADLDNFVVDGFESCLETGYGYYTGNVFLKNFYDKCVKRNKEALVTGSLFSQYSWHIMSHISWGEGDQERGVRGTMLDYRISRQMELRRNLMPNKLGQYYPSIATAEDINWIMALASGWDAGVDFQLNVETLKKNPEFQKISETLELWSKARSDNAFSESQKMMLRQTDVIYKLSKKEDGSWDLSFDRFWQNEKLKILSPSVMAATPVNGGLESVKPLSIDWSWTHNPGFYDEAGLSDDLVQKTGEKQTLWKISFPTYTENKKSWYPTSDRHFQFVIRLPENAPCAVKNIKVSVNGKIIDIPGILQPGEYISVPHLVEIACFYNHEHHIIKETYLNGSLPKVKKGEIATVGLMCEPIDERVNPEIIMNVRCQNGYFYHR